MTYANQAAQALRNDGWVLRLSLDPRGYLARAERGGAWVEGLARTPDAAYQRAWEAAEQLCPTFECDSCGGATSNLVELVSVGNAQVCGECYVLEEHQELEMQEAYHG